MLARSPCPQPVTWQMPHERWQYWRTRRLWHLFLLTLRVHLRGLDQRPVLMSTHVPGGGDGDGGDGANVPPNWSMWQNVVSDEQPPGRPV